MCRGRGVFVGQGGGEEQKVKREGNGRKRSGCVIL